MPQIELAAGDHVDVLVFRNMDAITPEDEALFKAYADQWQVQIWLQSPRAGYGAPALPARRAGTDLQLPEFGITMPFKPTEFTQVNPHQP